MDKLAQVLGILRALRSIATQANYTDVYKGMEAQCISMYRKCVEILKTIKDYEEIESIAPELSDSANMKEIGFAVEMLLNVVRSEEGTPGFGFSVCAPRHPRMPRHARFRRFGPGKIVIHSISDCGHRGDRAIEINLHKEMRDEMEEEQDRFEEEIEELEDKIEELQDKMEEARDRLEERLEKIREKYEEKIENLREEDDYGEDDHDDDDEDEPES